VNPDLHPDRGAWIGDGANRNADKPRDPAPSIDDGRASPVALGRVRGLSDEHRDAALRLFMDDRVQRKSNEVLMTLYREITTERLGQPQADRG
jgi:hypothetical protein